MPDAQTLQFLDYRRPSLKSGTYRINVEQSINAGAAVEAFKSIPVNFAVQGQRFALDPVAIHATFPPAGSLGDHSASLPHVALSRATFPWERSAYGGDDEDPWLALLLFDESEFNAGDVKLSVVSLQELQSPDPNAAVKFPGLTLETGQKPTDQVTVVDVKKSLLQAVIPTGAELKLLAHVRKTTGPATTEEASGETVSTAPAAVATGEVVDVNADTATSEVNEVSVIVGNRLPAQGADSTAVLVSVEGRYQPAPSRAFDFGTAQDADMVRLVALKSWSFACLADDDPESGLTFEQLVQGLDSGSLRLPNPNPSGQIQPEPEEDAALFVKFNKDAHTHDAPLNPHYPPWMFLMMLGETETTEGRVKSSTASLSELQSQSVSETQPLPQAVLEALAANPPPGGNVPVVDVEAELLSQLMPSAHELQAMTQAMRRMLNGDLNAAADAAIYSNRLPDENAKGTVFLAAVQDRYQGADFDFQNAQKGQFIRLVNLKSWDFTTLFNLDSLYDELRNAAGVWLTTFPDRDDDLDKG